MATPPKLRIFDIATRNFAKVHRGKLDLAMQSDNTIVAAYDASALDIAKRFDRAMRAATPVDAQAPTDARANAAGVVVVVVDRDRSPLGIVEPGAVIKELRKNKQIDEDSFADAIREFANDPKEIGRGYHHEWLTQRRVTMQWCERHGVWTLPPCRRDGH
jgi:glycosyltransferase involved in cell wall biosynthesis